jgi:hypothetical protein
VNKRKHSSVFQRFVSRDCEVIINSYNLANPQWTGRLKDSPEWIQLGISIFDSLKDFPFVYEVFPSASYKTLEKKEEKLNGRWVMKNGDQVLMDLSKAEVIRHSLSQLIHHRAQLGVYLRLLDIPIPGVYGPSADEMNP